MFRRTRAVAVVALAFSLLMAGCGGGDSESADGADDAVRTLETDGAGEQADASEAEEEIAAEFGVDANEVVADAEALPADTDGDGVVSEAENLEFLNSLMLEFSECIRNEGLETFEDITIEMFADANGQGPLLFFQMMIDRGLNPGTPEGQALLQPCQSILGQLQANAPEPSDEQIAAREANAVDWAACLREEGIEDFPDPDFVSSPPFGYGPSLQERFDFSQPPLSDAAANCAAQGRSLFGTDS